MFGALNSDSVEEISSRSAKSSTNRFFERAEKSKKNRVLQRRIAAMVVAWLSVVCIVISFAIEKSNAARAAVIGAWPTVHGRVVHNAADVRVRKTMVDVQYQFKVDDITYTSDSIRYGRMHWGDVKNYPVGKSVIVHYQPSYPSTSYLEKQSDHSESVRLFLLAGVGILVSLILLVTSIQPIQLIMACGWVLVLSSFFTPILFSFNLMPGCMPCNSGSVSRAR